MRNPFKSTFGAVFSAEVLFNSRRVAPYFLILLFTANAVLWWGWSITASYGWGTNSDFNIVRNLHGFSFILGLPIFNAIIMCDPVIRDFRIGIDPLIFSQPVSRASYLLGKFFGNFFVLVCCMSAFMLTMLVLQWFPSSRLVVLPVRVFPYFKHFFFFVVISHLFLAVVYFAVGTLTRNSKIVYGIAGAFYPVYVAYQLFLLKNLPQGWATILDPLMMGRSNAIPPDKWHDAAWINQIVVRYSSVMFANRVLWILLTVVCLTVVYFRFSIVERTRNQGALSLLDLSTPTESIQYDPETVAAMRGTPSERAKARVQAIAQSVPLPQVTRVNDGVGANLKKLLAATGVELHLLHSERSLLVLMPLAVLLSFLSLPFSAGVSDVPHSAAFARSTAQGSLLFLLGVIIFYTGEAMHRDRELRIEPGLWSAPAPNDVFLLSKFLATLSLALGLLLLFGLTATLTQLLRGLSPVEVSAYLLTFSVIVVPTLAFTGAACIALNVLLRDKYLAYAIIIAISSGLFYLYTQGYNHWLYNPVLYGLWSESDLTSTAGVTRLMILRIYCLGIGLLCIWLAHLGFGRKSGKSSAQHIRRSIFRPRGGA